MKRTLMSPFAAVLVLYACLASSPAQTPTPVAPAKPSGLTGSIAGHPEWPKAKAEDVATVEATVASVYSVISGPKGQTRDWDRMRSLFLPDGRLIPVRHAAGGHADATILTIDDYVTRSSKATATQGFYERSIANRVEQFGNIVSVWSTYESRHDPSDPSPFARGINTFQLLKDGDRFWVVQIFWDSETPTTPIPAGYLASPNAK